MKNKYQLLILALICPVMLNSQPLIKRSKYDISKDRVLYTVGYAHLDTEWIWDYPTVINEYIKNTMNENFRLFEKYPDYVFNFTGSRRYHMMKEYYPESFKKVAQYIKDGRWFVSGSSVDEGEVNVSSSESVIRQVLYGNNFFRKEFGVESKDYMLPDCFGFLASMPTIWNHCGLLGFSTQKLTWRAAVGVPFNVGVWNGPDGNGVIAALNATDYTGRIVTRLDLDSAWASRIDGVVKKTGLAFDYRYYGVGDQGGGPRDRDVFNAVGSIRNTDSKFKVVLTSSDQMYKDITPEIRAKLPTYSGELLLIEHSAGSLTSESYMKRANRKNELLAQSAEIAASAADWLGGAEYPLQKMNNSWELVLGSQFHDILPGTSTPKAYEYAWNDEFIAANGFAEVLKNSLGAISGGLDTRVKGRAVIVFNPVASDREDVAFIDLEYPELPSGIRVFDKTGKEVPSQVIQQSDKKLKVLFLVKSLSAGISVFDIRESDGKLSASNELKAIDNTIENKYYKVTIAQNGNISSIYDKILKKELLSKPADLEFQEEKPQQWPAWNMDWKDRLKPPVDFMDKEAIVKIVEKGPVRVALEVKRKGRNSEITQLISLTCGDAGRRIEITNKADWQSKEVSLKAAFPLSVSNEKATYNLGVGTIQRSNNKENQFEVPSHQWFDLTDKSGSNGVTILEDCKYGSDKPNDNTVRLTLLYTPYSHSFSSDFYHQNSQDWGIHDIRYGIFSHSGDWKGQSPQQGMFFNKPLIAVESPAHSGPLGKEISLIKISSPSAGVMAFKKMEQGEGYYIIRINELSGLDNKGIVVSLPGKITEAFEVNGQEQKTGEATIKDGKLIFDLSHYTIKSFAVRLQNPSSLMTKPSQVSLDIPFNGDVMSFDDNMSDIEARGRNIYGLPAELVPDIIVSEDIRFRMGSKEDRENNVVTCRNQKINLPSGNYNKIYLLAASSDDLQADFMVDGVSYKLNIQSANGYVGQFYNRVFGLDRETVTGIENAYSKGDNIAWFASHRHNAYPAANEAYKYSYIFKYTISVPVGSKILTLPSNQNIRIFAVTVAQNGNDDIKTLQPLYDDFSGNNKLILRK
jgi:alpha-mannosidase